MKIITTLSILLVLGVVVSCTDEGPGGRLVDLSFKEGGRFEERFLNKNFAGIAIATDTVAISTRPKLGPVGERALDAFDDDVLSYPFNYTFGPRVQTGIEGEDKRWWNSWDRYDGFNWDSYAIDMPPDYEARGAKASPPLYPVRTEWYWCDLDGECTPWVFAVLGGAVTCWADDPDGGDPEELSPEECSRYSPRRHWNIRVRECPAPEPSSGCRAVTYSATFED